MTFIRLDGIEFRATGCVWFKFLVRLADALEEIDDEQDEDDHDEDSDDGQFGLRFEFSDGLEVP